ncbi:uncharacterized protein L3040_001491 [Drepanopeziza brunnea f. sp. 'multigermtubi']|uniref:uncharacterized protein n=1 Tax=Drepanopeziza brunnea f. sp. 'multigermtubi' TaxID=698441 RepID=UPI0023877E8F|nr:hypothetical protein L3040_001491 [Drepanopeziza brunnea f. sp. 'multigermtubi']
MRFNNNFFLLASFLGGATAMRRSCYLDGDAPTNNGVYKPTDIDTIRAIAADFCTDDTTLLNLNDKKPPSAGSDYIVPCAQRYRDCARIPDTENGYYTVAQGDTIMNIARDFCLDSGEKVRSMNPDMKSDTVVTGSVLLVPCAWN